MDSFLEFNKHFLKGSHVIFFNAIKTILILANLLLFLQNKTYYFCPKISFYLLWGCPIDIGLQKIHFSNEIYHIFNLKIKYNSNALQKMLIFKYELWTKSELSMAVWKLQKCVIRRLNRIFVANSSVNSLKNKSY